MSPIPIGNPKTALALANFFDLKGKVGLVHDEVVVPVSLVGSLVTIEAATQAETDPDSGALFKRPYASFVGITGGLPGLRPGIQLINPTSSGELWRIEHIYAHPEVATEGTGAPLMWELYGHEPDLGVPAKVFPNILPARTRDGRSSPSFFLDVGSSGQVATEFPGGGHGQIGQISSIQQLVQRAHELPFEYVLPPDGSFVIQTRNDNNFSFLGIHFTIESL